MTFYDPSLLPWEHLVACSGEEGERWIAGYVDGGFDALGLRAARALSLLRSQRLAEARDEFTAMREEMERLPPDPPERLSVVRRFYLAASAYSRYLSGDYEGAKADLEGAQEAVETAIRQQPLLLPLAHHCLELQFQRARIARAQRRWSVVRRCCEQIAALADDRRPLCRNGDGEPLYLSTLGQYLLGLPGLTAAERDRIADIVDKRARVERLRRFSYQFYALPGFVIPYP